MTDINFSMTCYKVCTWIITKNCIVLNDRKHSTIILLAITRGLYTFQVLFIVWIEFGIIM